MAAHYTPELGPKGRCVASTSRLAALAARILVNTPQKRRALARFPSACHDGEMPALEVTSFVSLGLRSTLTDTLSALGYEEPTPVQREAIPLLLAGRDLVGQAETG